MLYIQRSFFGIKVLVPSIKWTLEAKRRDAQITNSHESESWQRNWQAFMNNTKMDYFGVIMRLCQTSVDPKLNAFFARSECRRGIRQNGFSFDYDGLIQELVQLVIIRDYDAATPLMITELEYQHFKVMLLNYGKLADYRGERMPENAHKNMRIFLNETVIWHNGYSEDALICW